jgi:hypothetical protein
MDHSRCIVLDAVRVLSEQSADGWAGLGGVVVRCAELRPVDVIRAVQALAEQGAIERSSAGVRVVQAATVIERPTSPYRRPGMT